MTGKPGESTSFLVKLKKVVSLAVSTTCAKSPRAALRNCLELNGLVA